MDDPILHTSSTFNPQVIAAIQERAELGRYMIRGFGAFRNVPRLDDLVFLTASMTRLPLEGYREKCDTRTVLGTRFAKRPMELEIPITVAGMSFGALSKNAKVALGQAATWLGTSTTTGDGGMLPAERDASAKLVYQCLPSRYGFNPKDLKKADAIEIVIGQGAKPGGGGLLMGQKVNAVVAGMRTLPEGVDQRSPSRHPDWIGPDDLRIKIEELREATDWEIPIYIKMGATRVKDDVKLAVKAGADVIVLDGMEGGTAATQSIFQEHSGIPTLPALVQAVEALKEIGVYGEVQLVISGGIRSGPDVAKALALGADAVSIGTSALIAMGCNKPVYIEDYQALGTEPYHCHHCHTGRCPVGITTQDEDLMARLPIEEASTHVANYLQSMVMEAQSLARSCGKSSVHNLEREDLVALTLEASAMAKLPLAGTDFILGQS
ncbi:FMN-binding glutamate synthase family protein [Pseudanabaena sp. FACHB-2040]|uniref:FMN-binding glutamate synthase family protein n=1 Tax=Pseudanabaena sp. FACHB-2040 TaxID=2692859 RepID=UPI001689DC39|nr:FMN-binding glutamate synthase family protein [Pseudanabaena sp. FACHB-2040]MBD2260384.1 FMN-binding glutamate synthase family protein [Pseudanabaena sp. FACHB-2040]